MSLSLCVAFATLGLQVPAHAGTVTQWATSATATSQYYSGKYNASEATGAPNATGCDKSGVWAADNYSKVESLTLTYATAVVPTAINAHQNNAKGAISKIEVSANGTSWTRVYTGDPTKAVKGSCLVASNYNDILSVSVTGKVAFPITQVRITVDQSTVQEYAEIDAVELVGAQKSAQTIGSVASSLQVGRTVNLPAKTNKSLTITWKSTTGTICSVSSGVLKGLKKGTCKITGTNAGNSSYLLVTVDKVITIR